MHLSKFVHTTTGRYIMSIILGFGLASLFREVCKDKGCIVFKAPPLDDIDGKTFKINDKCYNFNNVSSTCDKNKENIHFA
jgi:hypothetical protein